MIGESELLVLFGESKKEMMESSPSASSSESTRSEYTCSRTTALSSPLTLPYDLHGHGNHHASSRYVSVLSSCVDSTYAPTPFYTQNIQDDNSHPSPIKYETALHFHREGSDVFKNLENVNENSNQRVNVGKSSLSLTQIECICEAMLQRKDIKRLDEFLKSIPHRLHFGSEPIYRARIHVFFHRQEFNDMYEMMKCFNFSIKYHSELQELWYQAHYKEQENMRGRDLGAVDKYRIRNKFQLPKTIWDGEKTTYCFKDRAREALKECYSRCRYPTPNEKKVLSDMTGLTSIQVSNWFKNKRQRDRTPQSRERSEMGCMLSLGLQSDDHGKGGDDSSSDMKPLVTFRTTSTKQMKLSKSFPSGRMSMLDLSRPLSLRRKEGVISSSLPHITITPRTNQSSGTALPSHALTDSQTVVGSGGNNVSVIQSLSGAHSQFYPQAAQYDALIHSPHHYAHSPQILSYG